MSVTSVRKASLSSSWTSLTRNSKRNSMCLARRVSRSCVRGLRWYYTPAVLSKFNAQTTNPCWRQCGGSGDLLHILWNCPKLRLYWDNVFHVVSEVVHARTERDPALALLSLGIELLRKDKQHVVVNLLLAARLSITRKWKHLIPPTIAEVIDLTNLHYTHKRLLASSLGRLNLATDMWSPWSNWFASSEEFSM